MAKGRCILRYMLPKEHGTVRDLTAQPEEKRFERLLRPYRKDRERAREELADLGFTLRGSIGLRRFSCGKAGCRCRTSGKGHGPYYQITWKEGGKSRSCILPPELVPLYQEWLSNGRALDQVVDRMLAVSRKAADAVRGAQAHRAPAEGARKRYRRRS